MALWLVSGALGYGIRRADLSFPRPSVVFS